VIINDAPFGPATSSTAGIVKITDTVGADASDTAPSVTALNKYIDDGGFDIIILAGQSNMVGYGNEAITDFFDGNVESGIYQLGQKTATNGFVGLAKDSLDHADGGGLGTSIGMTFARLYKKYSTTKRSVLLVPCAYQGTALVVGSGQVVTINGQSITTHWNPGGANNLYTLMMRRINLALAYDPLNNPTPAYS
jgi:hypothetical protein